MKLTFLGGAKMVTGSQYLLEANDGTRVLIDCGLHQGSNFCERHNWEPFLFEPSSVNAVFVTHAHIDHVGRLPSLVRGGFTGEIFSTAPTRDIAHLSLLDSDHVLARDAERFNLPMLFDDADVEQVSSLWKIVEYHTRVSVGPFTATFFNAAHILGSAFILIEVDGKRIVFSGDLGNAPAPLIGSWELPPEADVVLVESTYGGRVHEALPERKELLRSLITDTVKRGGTLMIPAFAVERTQEILFELHDLSEKGFIPRIPIFLDSPLAIRMTEIYLKYSSFLTREAKTRSPGEKHPLFEFPGLRKTLRTEESKAINDVAPPKVIIAGSGMSHGGRILHHERRYLSDPNSMLLVVGYQAKGSLGRALLDHAPTVKIFGEDVPVRARIKAIGGYSAHADQPQLLRWLSGFTGTKTEAYVVQGEIDEATALKEKIERDLKLRVSIPTEGSEVVL